MGPVGNDFVYIHVGLGSGSGLPDDQGELVIKPAFKDLIANFPDQGALLRRKHTQIKVGEGSRFFQGGKGINDLTRHTCFRSDSEIVPRAFGLGAPVFISRDHDFAHGVVFCSVFHIGSF